MNTANARLFAGRRHVRDERRGSGKLSHGSAFSHEYLRYLNAKYDTV